MATPEGLKMTDALDAYAVFSKLRECAGVCRRVLIDGCNRICRGQVR